MPCQTCSNDTDDRIRFWNNPLLGDVADCAASVLRNCGPKNLETSGHDNTISQLAYCPLQNKIRTAANQHGPPACAVHYYYSSDKEAGCNIIAPCDAWNRYAALHAPRQPCASRCACKSCARSPQRSSRGSSHDGWPNELTT